ncbi:hypothetical protein [Microlunatus sp. Gsoil 973]|uniref:OB-fold protein n=1 Tax=Microlunatus sp. Gsoil 973 TaxID=2672569 RepID=UPI0018A87C14|nr:hypothetical protein [Microlunatus sp. Gsoil 973]
MPNYQPPRQQPKAKGHWLRTWLFAGGALIIGIVIGTTGGGNDDAAASDPRPTTTVTERATAPASAPSKSKASSKPSTATKPKATKKPASKIISVKASKVVKEFEDNEFAADNKYKGKTLKITGRVDKVDTDLFDDSQYILDLGEEYELLSVQCYDIPNGQLAKVSKGDTVTVIGRFDDGGDFGVKITDAEIV